MSVACKIEDGGLVLSFTGAIEASTVQQVRSCLASLEQPFPTKVLFDVSGATAVDCTAWGEILQVTLEHVKQQPIH